MSEPLDHLVSTIRAGACGLGDELHAGYRQLREAAPLYRCPWGDWYVSSHELARTLLLSRNTMRHGELAINPPAAESGTFAAQKVLRQWLLCIDPPAHTLLRSAFAGAFSPGRIEALRQEIRRLAQQLWSDWLANPDANVVDAVAQPLPVLVIARLLGLPMEDAGRFHEWNRVWRQAIDRDDLEGYAHASTVAAEMTDYLNVHVEQGAQHAASALDYPALIDRFGREAIVANLGLLLFAGSETTGHLLSSLLLLLSQHPSDWQAVRQRRAGLADVIAETLRCESPVQKISFRAMTRTELAGETIAAGDVVVVLVGAAHRDPAAYEAAERFWIGRPAVAELAFGAGPHACLGRRLAQVEAEIFLQVAAELLDEVHVPDGGWRWLPETTFRALQHLDLRVRQVAHQVPA